MAGLCWVGTAWGQEAPLSTLRQKVIAVQLPGQLLDSFSIVPQSLIVRDLSGRVLSSSTYELSGRYLSWRSVVADSVRIQYRILPFDLQATASLIDSSQLQRDTLGLVIGSYNPFESTDPFGKGSKLNYSGSFTRGFSFGNRQDLVLNSSFNLNMSGELGDGIQVTAAITDENLPIQPQGNTQQLREFDRVFIRLRKNDYQLTAGDYELNRPDGYFVQYFRKLEGATFEGRQAVGASGSIRTQASVAVARGEFTRQQIVPGEGNQGPYRLAGDGQQRFLIILAGTERVFFDGVLLTRGRDADYVIDYNLGEITFTPRRLITKDSRITIEYEFVNQRYLRSLYALNTTYENRGWKVYANLISQQDSRNATGELDLNAEQREALAAAGDAQEQLLLSAIDTLEGPPEQRVTYALVDTLVPCSGALMPAQILRFTTDPEAGRYVATFSNVGPGQGNYLLATDIAANERVYRYIAPDSVTCQPRGTFEPVVQLIPPQQQQMLAVGTERRIGQTGQVRLELSGTREDLNRFSRLDAADDRGWAGRLDYGQTFPLQRDSTGWQLEAALGYEHVQRFFRPFSPYRSPEFLRDWNLANVLGLGVVAPADEDLYRVELALARPDWGRLAYRLGGFHRGEQYDGTRHGGTLSLRRAGWQLQARGDWLDATTAEERSQLVRPNVRLSKSFDQLGGWQANAWVESERSERRSTAGGLQATSFFFERWGAGIDGPNTESGQVSLNYRQRRDYRPDTMSFERSFTATEWEVVGSRQWSKALQLRGNFSYRRLEVANDQEVPSNQTPGETFLGRLDLNGQFWKGALNTTTTYEIGSGQEPRVEFTYLFVGAGQGQYIWLDSLFNNDGKIQPNEMEIAPFPDVADYVRVSNLTDQFIRTDNTTLNQSIQWSPERLWRGADGFRGLLAKLALQSSLTIARKTRDAAGVQPWNPLQLNVADSALVSLSASQRHGLFFNRANPRYDVQLERTDLRRRLVLATGFESQQQQLNTLRLRFSPGPAANLRLNLSVGRRSSDSEQFNEKDYEFEVVRLEPQVVYQPGRRFRLNLSGIYGIEENQLEAGAGESAVTRELSVEGNYQRWLQARLRYVNIDFEGEASSPIGFALLNGLQPGRNFIWSTSATQQIGRFLQLSISYEGRQTGTARTVHVGRAQVTAIF